jgi:8-oxo-dGTP pyrophosphatase MutT (NUDIX family)
VIEITLDSLKERVSSYHPIHLPAPDIPQAAVAVVIVPSPKSDLELLFIRRAELESDPWSGHIAFPGGRRHSADLDLRETAIRETEEEVGLRLPLTSLLTELDDVRPRSPALPPLLIRPHLFAVEERPVLTLSDEVADALWIQLSRLRQSRGNAFIEIRGRRLSEPAFLVGESVIWGLTERILSQFINLLDG